MSFRSYQEGLKQATDLANRAIQIESSLSALSPLASPLPTLQKAFPAYISSAEAYSHLLASNLVPASDVVTVRKKWRLVLERAEKIKARIESLGSQVGKVEIGDQGEEDAVIRRGGKINGVTVALWAEPSCRLFQGERYREDHQPELAEEQIKKNPIWSEVQEESWKEVTGDEWVMRQGPVSDCSVVAAMGVELGHNRKFGTDLAWSNLYPKANNGKPRRSDNGKHVLKLLLNGAWRSVVMDATLPHSSVDHTPLYTTCLPSSSSASTTTNTSGAPWAPLALKGYFKVFGGYSLRGSNPAPDIYAFTGWIPERISLREGFQREKEWKKLSRAWKNGEVMISLGTGERVRDGLVKLHAYGVLGLREDDDQRLLEVFDPGAATLWISWDQVCSDFEALHCNWNPNLKPVVATRHWSWPKPINHTALSNNENITANPQYRLKLTDAPLDGSEIWLLLSQHVTSKDRPLDDIALHVFEDYEAGPRASGTRLVQPKQVDQASPYANSIHILTRYQLRRRSDSTLLVIPARDRGNFQTGFTLQALAPSGSTLSFERVSYTLPFSQSLSASLNSRNAGGHAGYPTHMINPQYSITVETPDRGSKADGRILLQGDKEVAWNVKLLWGKGELVSDVTEDMIVCDTGPYSFGIAYCDFHDLNPGTYTLIVSDFEPGQIGPFTLTVESKAPVNIKPIPAEGAGMFSRVIQHQSETTAGGRPSGGRYERNPSVEVIMPNSGVVL
ncbi:calpain-like protease palB/RIM13 [Kwoniella heveanensis BCC8398]|uniref:Calpain-like protease palB/RIM13 n=1 Tax=Kwoniella heveanensis BCC8398 TaxID=1296120 RepID=A0A1B9GU99_9TREE|nr:calpain-like protease palB/RIM13 [Kwoniella heveanensis BCC8398]